MPAGAAQSPSSAPLRYGCRVTLYKQALDGYVVSTSSAAAPVGVKRYDAEAGSSGGGSVAFEQTIFVVCAGDPAEGPGGADPDSADGTVKYGKMVRLLHQTHQKPLCYDKEQHAAGLKGNLRVGLEKRRGRAHIGDRWRIMPRYRLRFEGEPVADGDPVVLQSSDGERYLNVCDRYDEEMSGGGRFYEVSCGSELQGFQVGVYDGDVGPHFPAATLRCGDCVTLLHTEEHKYVLADVGSRTCLLQTPEARQEAGLLEGGSDISPLAACSAGGLDRCRQLSANQACDDEVGYLSLFVIESVDPRRGGAIPKRGLVEVYRLKSLYSGLYLQTGEVPASAMTVSHIDAAVDISFSNTGGNGDEQTWTHLGTSHIAASSQIAVCGSSGGGLAGDAAFTTNNGSPTGNVQRFATASSPSPSPTSSEAGRTGAKERRTATESYVFTLSDDRHARGTLFKIHAASTTAAAYLCNGDRIFLEAVNAAVDNQLWLAAGPRVHTQRTQLSSSSFGIQEGEDTSEITIATLAERTTMTGRLALYGRPFKSMRDGLEMRRLTATGMRQLSTIRGLLSTLSTYATRTLNGVCDPHHTREVRENVVQLRRLCHRCTAAGSLGSMDADGVRLADERNEVEGVLNPEWQRKLFSQGVPALVLQVAYSTIHCPYVTVSKLFTADVVGASAGEHGGFVPMRYSELGDLVDACFECVATLVTGKPRYAESLRTYADFMMKCCEHVPSALKCLAVFYKDNPTYVELPMARSRLDFFLKMLVSRGRDPDVLEIVRLFAQCGEESMVEAQQVILDFFSDESVARKIMCPVRMMKPAVAVSQKERGGHGNAQLSGSNNPFTGEGTGANGGAGSGVMPTSCNPLLAAVEGPECVSVVSRARERNAFWSAALDGDKEIAFVAVPNSIFIEDSDGDSISIAASTQYRGKGGGVLAELLQSASTSEDALSSSFFPLDGLVEVLQDWPEVKDVFVPYYTAQIRLLAALGRGDRGGRVYEDRSLVYRLISLWVPRSVLQYVLTHGGLLPGQLYASFLLLFASTIRECGITLQVEENLQNMRCVVSCSQADRRAADSSLFTLSNVPSDLQLGKNAVLAFLSSTAVSAEEEAALLYVAMLTLCGELLKCGAFSFSELPLLVRSLTNALDPTTDSTLAAVASREHYSTVGVRTGATHVAGGGINAIRGGGGGGRGVETAGTTQFSTTLESQPVHDIKVRAVRLIDLIADIVVAYDALQLVDLFRAKTQVHTQVSQLLWLAIKTGRAFFLSTGGAARRGRLSVSGATGTLPGATRQEAPMTDIKQMSSDYMNTFGETNCTTHGTRSAASSNTNGADLQEMTARVFTALLAMSTRTESRVLRADCIRLFFRLTNSIEGLRNTASRVQLLASEASISFYTDVSHTATALEALSKKSFRRSNTVALAHAALDALDQFLSTVEHGAAAEKLAMMRHVGIPIALVALLRRVPVPIPSRLRSIIYKTVSLLQTMAQDPQTLGVLRDHVELFTPLVALDTNVLSLLRILFLNSGITGTGNLKAEYVHIPSAVLTDVVRCFSTTHSAQAAVDFMIDVLCVTTSSGRPIVQHQYAVWRAIVSDVEAVQLLQFRQSGWCGKSGGRLRELVLTSYEYYIAGGRLARHLSLCRLLYLIANRNELVKPEEIRHEVFGMNSVDSLLEVCTDARLPAFFRREYMLLLQVLVLDDKSVSATLFSHHLFADLLHTASLDTARYMQLCGGHSFFPETDEEVERREDAAMRCVPANSFEKSIDDARAGLAVHRSLFFSGICPMLRRVCMQFKAATMQLNSRLRSRLWLSVCDVVDVICDLFSFVHTQRQRHHPHNNTLFSMNVVKTTAAPSSDTSGTVHHHGQVQLTRAQVKELRECFDVFKEALFHGTSRWCGDAFERVYALVAEEDQNSTNVEAARLNSDRNRDKRQSTTINDDAHMSGGEAKHDNHNCLQALGPDEDELPFEGFEGRAVKLPEPTLEVRAYVHADDSMDSSNGFGSCNSNEQVLTEKWGSFLDATLLQSESMEEAHLYASAAGVLLRTGDHGTAFVRTLLCTLPAMGADYVTRTLQLVRQLVLLQKDDPHDASSVLPFREMESELPCLSLDMTLSARLTTLAKWPGDLSLEHPMPLLPLTAEYVGAPSLKVQRAALLGAITLLTGGHRGMQESYYRYCMSTPHEQLFFVLRNHMTGFLDELRTYHYALTRGSTPSEAQHFLKHMAGCTLELQLLRLLCAGQFAPIQTYLVAQPDNTVSVNLIELLVDLVSMGPKAADEVTAPFFLQLLSTISETLQGPCRVNQDSFVAYKVADFLTHMLSEHTLSISTPEEARVTRLSLISSYEEEMPVHQTQKADGDGATSISEVRRGYRTRLQTAALSTLLALIEGRQDPTFAARLLATVDLSVLGRSMDRSAAAYEHRHGSIVRVHSRGVWKGDIAGSFRVLYRYFRDFIRDDLYSGREELQDELALGVSIYTFFRALYDMQALATMAQLYAQAGVTGGRVAVAGADLYFDKMGRSIKQVLRKTQSYKKIGSRVSKVEVVRNGVLERVYFRVLAASEDNWYAEMRHRTVEKAIRSSDNDRLQYFFKRSSNIVVEMDTYGRLRKIPPLFLLNYSVVELTALLLCMIVAINLVMAIGIRAPTSPYSSGTSKGIDSAMFGLSVAIIIAQGLRTLHALLGPAAVNVIRGWRLWRLRREERLAQEVNADMAADAGDYERLLAAINADGVPWYSRASRTIALVALTPAFLQQGFFLFVSIMGFVQHPIWHSAQLLQIVLSSSVLMNLFNALLVNVTSLILTFVLLLLMIFISSAISFFNFAELFDPLGSYGNGMNCYTLSQCWLVHLDTLRLTGGMGDIARWPTFYSEDGYGYWFAFFRLAYFVVVCLIVSNMFFGVVVDSLAQSRVARDFVKVDQQKKCFICGVERNVFDVIQPGMYDTHIKEEHNMWQYVFFLHYLSEKDPDTFTGQEAYVSHLISLRDITFYPIGRSVVLDTLGERGTDQSARVQGDQTLPNGPAGTMEERLLEIMRGALDPVRENQRNIQDTLRVVLEKLGNVTSNGGALNPSTKSSS